MAQQSMALGMTDPSGAAATWRAYMSRNVKNIVTASSIAAEFRSVGDPISMNNRYNYKQKVVTGIHGTPFDQQTDDNYWQSKQMLPNILRPLGSGLKNAAIINQGIYNINPIGGTNDFSGAVISRASGVNPTNYTLVGTDDLQDRIRANAVPSNDPLSAQYASQLAPGAQIDPNNIEGDAQINTFASKQSINRQAKTQLIDPNLVDPNSNIDDPTLQSGLMNRALNHQLRNHIARLTPGRRLRNAIQAHQFDQAHNALRARLHGENAALIAENPEQADVIDAMVDDVQDENAVNLLDDEDIEQVAPAAAQEPQPEAEEEEEAADEEQPGIPPGGGGGGGGGGRGPGGGGGAAGGGRGGGGRGGRGGGDDRGGRGIRKEARKDPMNQLSYTRGGSGYMGDSDHVALSTQPGESSTLQKVRRLALNVREDFANNPTTKKIDALHEQYVNNNSSPALHTLATTHAAQLACQSLMQQVHADVRAPLTGGGSRMAETVREGTGPVMPGAVTPTGEAAVARIIPDRDRTTERPKRDNYLTDPVVLPGPAPGSHDRGPVATMKMIVAGNAGDLNAPENAMIQEMLTEMDSHIHVHNETPEAQVQFLLKIFARIQTSGKEIVKNAHLKVMRMLNNDGGFEKLLQMAQSQQDSIVSFAMDIENEGVGMKELLKMQEDKEFAKKQMADDFNQRNVLRNYFTNFKDASKMYRDERGAYMYGLNKMFQMYKSKTLNRSKMSDFTERSSALIDRKIYATGVAKGANALMVNKNYRIALRERMTRGESADTNKGLRKGIGSLGANVNRSRSERASMDIASNADYVRMARIGINNIRDYYLKKSSQRARRGFQSDAEAKDSSEVDLVEKGFNNRNEVEIENARPIEPIETLLTNANYVDLTGGIDIDEMMDAVSATPFGVSHRGSFLGQDEVRVTDFTPSLRMIADSARQTSKKGGSMDSDFDNTIGVKRTKDDASFNIGGFARMQNTSTKIAAQGTHYGSQGGAIAISSGLPAKLAVAADNLSTTNLLQPVDNTTTIEDISAQVDETSNLLWERMSSNFARSLETVANNYLRDNDEKGMAIMDAINRRRLQETNGSSFADEYEYGGGVHYARNLKAFGESDGTMEVFANPTLMMIARRQEANAVMQLLGGYYRHTYSRVMAVSASDGFKGGDTDDVAQSETRRFLNLMDRVMAENLPYEPVELLTMLSSVGEKAAIRAMVDWKKSIGSATATKRAMRARVEDVVPFASGDVRFKLGMGIGAQPQSFELSSKGTGGAYVKSRR